MEYRYDTHLLIEGGHLDEDAIRAYFLAHFEGDCLLAVGDEICVKIHFHTEHAVAGTGILCFAGRNF